MIDLATAIAYIAVVLGFVFIPGPATLLTIARATSSGTRVGIATGGGIAAGDVFHTAMAMVGISAIIATSATLFSIVKYIGAAYLFTSAFGPSSRKRQPIRPPARLQAPPASRFDRLS